VSYNTVLNAWKESQDPARALELLDIMDEKDLYSYNICMWALAKQGNHQATMALLRQLQNDDDNYLEPDIISYNACLYSFAASRDPGVALRGENLLKEIIASEGSVRPDTISFNTIIYLWSRVAAGSSTSAKASLSAAQRAHQLLHHMEQLYDAGNNNVKPDVYSYSTVIQAFSYAQQPRQSQDVLHQMTRRGLRPNRVTYTSVLSAMAKLGQAEQAQKLLDELLLLDGKETPDTVTFSVVMDAYAKKSSTEHPWAADKAMELLDRMNELGIPPNAYTMSSLFTALANSGQWESCQKAHRLLQDMMENNDSEIISTMHFNSVIAAYAKSPRADKALKACDVLKALEAHPQCEPDIISFNSLLLAAANAFGNRELKDKSFSIALFAFKSAMENEGLTPTSTTISHFCKSARRLIADPQERFKTLHKVFQIARQRGLMTTVIMQQLQMACDTNEEWEQVIGKNLAQRFSRTRRIPNQQFPADWTQNARR
jgi:pentatricopeptide repeat protein